jgi:ubiquinone biosynthesis protein
VARNLGPIGKAEGAGRAVLTLAEVVSDIPDLAQRLRRILVRLDESAPDEAQLALAARKERQRAVWSTVALWAIAVGALVMAFR